MIGPAPVCLKCIHYNDDLTCKAFPNGIPDEVVFNGNDHAQPIEGDNGIQFEPVGRKTSKARTFDDVMKNKR